jgi:hypothetical protein
LANAGKPPHQESNWALKLEALEDAGFVVRSAVSQPRDLVLGQ